MIKEITVVLSDTYGFLVIRVIDDRIIDFDGYCRYYLDNIDKEELKYILTYKADISEHDVTKILKEVDEIVKDIVNNKIIK